jgi:hypothetical protein
MASKRRKKEEEYQSPIKGHVDVFAYESEPEYEPGGVVKKWVTVMIHGDPEGLRSLAQFLLEVADTNQEEMKDLPIGDSDHKHLVPNADISKSSNELIIGRLDSKGTGEFYERYIPIDRREKVGGTRVVRPPLADDV